MRFAVLADIHGNAHALEAVLADMQALGVTEAVNLGDHLSGPLDARATADRLMSCGFPSIRGNHDRWLLELDPAEMGPSDKVAYEALDQTHLDWLAAMPATRTVFADVFLCHGTPSSDETYWLERVTTTGMVRQATKDEIEREATGIDAAVILCAHTHIPRLVRLGDGRLVLNPGSVGCPAYDDDTPVYHLIQTGTPNASYAIVEGTGRNRSITFRSVPYETAGMAAMARSHGRDEWASAVTTGWLET